jgi:N-acetylmuramoyl-L-alanine amidase
VPGSEAPDLVYAKAQEKDGIYALLRRYQLPTTSYMVSIFRSLNSDRLSRQGNLLKGFRYRMPIRQFDYNGQSIRSSIGIEDMELALRIKQYNEQVARAGVKAQPYTKDRRLWVPEHELKAGPTLVLASETSIDGEEAASGPSAGAASAASTPAVSHTVPVFGPKYEAVTVQDRVLEGCVYYLVSGHGGPDPGAQGQYNGRTLSEDEYAYDVMLRVARRLMEHSATVYILIQDDDGIRDDEYLLSDKDEINLGGAHIDRSQRRRLQQRADRINALYDQHKKTARLQRALIIHVDAQYGRRANPKDVYFLYHEGSTLGLNMSHVLRKTFEEKYNRYQPGRGYGGLVTTRNLYMLRETKPPAVLVELGNIRNLRDQMRLLKVNNRQALANWFTEGLIREAQ